MKLTNEELEILKLIEENHKISVETVALMVMSSEETVRTTIKKLEAEKVIISYPALNRLEQSRGAGKHCRDDRCQGNTEARRGIR